MNLSNLTKTTERKKKRIGRGYGVGPGGHTVGRGQKGQNSRSGGGPAPVRDYGNVRGFTPLHQKEPAEISLSRIADFFDDGSSVTPQTLLDLGLVDEIPQDGVKILGTTPLGKVLIVKGVSCSAGAKAAIERAGGQVQV